MAELGDHSSDGRSEDYSSRAWEKCKKLAKNIFIAGIAISSTPIIIPSILLSSTLGIALAVPFGFLFAGYAWTEKVMASLLPSPAAPLDEEKFLRERRYDGEVPEEEEFLKGSLPQEVYSVVALSSVDVEVFVEECRPSLEPVSSSSTTVEKSPFQDEDLKREKTIRKEIDDIRRIIGSMGDPEPYCGEELKALYLFLGIEPPVFSQVSSSIESVEGQLQLLKSIIGVK